jgi:hypothetical protein
MLISYCQLPMPQRERIIFSENYHELENAITAKRCVAFSTIWSSEQHNVAPYKLTIGKDEMFN